MRKVLFILFLSLFYACGGGGSDNNSPNWHQNSSGDWVVMEVFFPDSADGLIPDLLFKTVYASGGIGTEPAQGTIVVVQKIYSDSEFCSLQHNGVSMCSGNQIINPKNEKRYDVVLCSWMNDSTGWTDYLTTVGTIPDDAGCDFYRYENYDAFAGGSYSPNSTGPDWFRWMDADELAWDDDWSLGDTYTYAPTVDGEEISSSTYRMQSFYHEMVVGSTQYTDVARILLLDTYEFEGETYYQCNIIQSRSKSFGGLIWPSVWSYEDDFDCPPGWPNAYY